MNDNTINADMTMGAGAATLAGRYKVVKQLGQGGMGSVWLAEDVMLDGRQVAIKMLPSVLISNKRAYKQIKSEALVSLKLSHSNIAPFRSFEDNNGNPFLVVDFIDGETLDDYLADHDTLSDDDARRILLPIAEALDYAHSEGVIHRDVKPANVMIRKDGHPFILDFGIARELQETMTKVTGSSSSGTLMYMSPEQLNGEIPTAAQDIYSFAAMCYECFCGHPPFERGSIEHQILEVAPKPITGTVYAETIMAGLAKKAEDRPKCCVELFGLSAGEAVRQEQPDAIAEDIGGASRPLNSVAEIYKQKAGALSDVSTIITTLETKNKDVNSDKIRNLIVAIKSAKAELENAPAQKAGEIFRACQSLRDEALDEYQVQKTRIDNEGKSAEEAERKRAEAERIENERRRAAEEESASIRRIGKHKFNLEQVCNSREEYQRFAEDAHVYAMGIYPWNNNPVCERNLSLLNAFKQEVGTATLGRCEDVQKRIVELVQDIEAECLRK